MKVRSLSHVGITVKDFGKAVKWYHDNLGFWLIDEKTLNTDQVDKLYSLYGIKNVSVKLGFLRCKKGGVVEIFQFSKTEDIDRLPWNSPGITHLTLDVKNVDKIYEDLKKKGVEFMCEPQETDGNKWVFLKDLDGNLIELIDLKFNYFVIRVLGGMAGYFMAKKKFNKYYQQ